MENQPIKVEEQAVFNLGSKFDALNQYLLNDITNLFHETEAVINDCKGAYAGQLSFSASITFVGIYNNFAQQTGLMPLNLKHAAKDILDLDLQFGQKISGES